MMGVVVAGEVVTVPEGPRAEITATVEAVDARRVADMAGLPEVRPQAPDRTPESSMPST